MLGEADMLYNFVKSLKHSFALSFGIALSQSLRFNLASAKLPLFIAFPCGNKKGTRMHVA